MLEISSFAPPGPPPALDLNAAASEGDPILTYRRIGDPLADATVAALFESGDLDLVRQLMRHLVRNDHPLLSKGLPEEERLPPALIERLVQYFEQSDAGLGDLDAQRVRRGELVFAEHGPEILAILATYSLPASYTARRGVQVLAQTGRLESDPVRRLIETTQMVVDVLSPGGLAFRDDYTAHGKGVRTTQKVRLMHAAIRRLILEHYGEEWVEQFGVPINQMDLAGTLMTFSSVVLDGLAVLDVKLSETEQEDYLYTWRAIGGIVGLRPELIPENVRQASRLTARIRKLEIGSSPQGKDLTLALVDALRTQVEPSILRGLPVALMRRFLGEYADVIAVPRADWTAKLIPPLISVSGWLDGLHREFRVTAWIHRRLALALIRGFLDVERGGNRPEFAIPDHLADGWGLAAR